MKPRAILCRTLIGAFLSFYFFVSSLAYANTENADLTSMKFEVSDFVVEGDNPLSRGVTERIIEPFKNRELNIEQLRAVATELEKELARNGYNFYRVILPAQRLQDSVVRLEIKRIEIDNVVVVGNQYFSNRNVQRSLPLLVSGTSPNTHQIANALLLAEDNPSKDVRIVFVKGEKPQSIDANITVKDQNPNDVYLWANNAGSRLTSKSRLGIQYHNRNLWGRDHQVALSYTVSPEDTDELRQYGVNYRFPVYAWRGMANLFYSKSDADTGRVADVFDISGAGETVGIGYTQYLDNRGAYQHRLGINLIDTLFDSDILFGRANIGEDVRSRPLVLEYISRFDFRNWQVNSSVSHANNLSGGSFNDDQSYALTRAGADSSWNKQNIALRVAYQWTRDWRGQFSMQGQRTSDALIPGEQFGMGGAFGESGPRGFYEREAAVDEGVKTSFELIRSFPVQRMQLGVFYDYATGDINNAQLGEADAETLSSIGLSYKWRVRSDLSLDVEYGYILDGIDQQFSDGSDDGDSRVHFSLRYFPKWLWKDS